MLHIVLWAQAWGDMAEVHLFGDYLNLHGYSIAARGEEREGSHQRMGEDKWREHRNKCGRRRAEEREIKEEGEWKEKSRGDEVIIFGRVSEERTKGQSRTDPNSNMAVSILTIFCWKSTLEKLSCLHLFPFELFPTAISPEEEASSKVYGQQHTQKHDLEKSMPVEKICGMSRKC